MHHVSRSTWSLVTLALLVFGIGVARVHAAPASEITLTLHEVAAASAYGGSPEVLGFDVTVVAPRGDVLDALFVQQLGTAQWQTDITKATLWSDSGPVGFQGISIDTELTSGRWIESERGWVFDRVFAPVVDAGTRFFVTVSIFHTPTDGATVQLRIPVYRDGFLPMQYDTGDLGVFLRTARPAPLEPIANRAAHTIIRSTTDSLPPVVRMTEPKDSTTLDRDWLVVRGIAQDVGGSATAKVLVGVNRLGKEATWVEAVPEAPQFATWEARLFGLPRGSTIEIRVRGEDWIGNRSATSAPITVTLTNP